MEANLTEKMDEKCPITVSLLDEPFSELRKAGVPVYPYGRKGTMLLGSNVDGQQSKSIFSIGFLGDQCEARTKMFHPFTLNKKRKTDTKHPRLPTRTKELSKES